MPPLLKNGFNIPAKENTSNLAVVNNGAATEASFEDQRTLRIYSEEEYSVAKI